ncbi:ATP-dependent sacrificial sulfur transferase LarE [Clostridium sp. CF012]|uniref:ATP-dependent sacrificial sulfur transferase LarE n=1 Tax=Clostridium sp. CF012 TaxID=2843319 RepID=UPI001C0A9484|nr:ATP-dependent sacrificial sulfur transferase LarE [Clostridium sp. CF012]MBU3143182.1 ATP-dependent sacrificial sulfur transferase LarE [Clostridium sp. CF012]
MLKRKHDNLINYLKNLGSVAVAFSGGVDSTLLLKVCSDVLKENVLAIMVIAPYTPKWEVEEAKVLLKQFGVKYKFIEVEMIDEIRFSPRDRCYICKNAIFTKIKQQASAEGIYNILDGTNFDDTKDYRPGLKALKELNIISPLLVNEFTKADIRALSEELKLQTWNKPAYACLLSRIPYGQEVIQAELERIETAEVYLMGLGFSGVRVRSHEDLARIELPKKYFDKILNEKVLEKISIKLKELGFKYVTLDLEGYKMGSLN